jgi:hypothetical protein
MAFLLHPFYPTDQERVLPRRDTPTALGHEKEDMMKIAAITTAEILNPPSRVNAQDSSFSDKFSIMKADALLQTTRQHGTWLKIQQENPSKTIKIANLILERHTFIEGSSPRDESGRKHFDHMTDQLRAEGIHLYKSHEFKNPIFAKLDPLSPSGDIRSDGALQIDAARVDTTMQNINARFENKDCLEFLAGVLEEKGIAYYGEEGMAHTLVTKAKNEGKKINAYLTGEGITQSLCRKPVTIHVRNSSSDSFEAVWNKIEPHMKKGSILSFSSRSFGHTGIIDTIDNRLAFLNSSGIPGKPKTYQVLAEEPRHEIRTWLQRARRQNTFLDITIGGIDPMLANQFDNPSLAVHRAQPPGEHLMTSHRFVHGNQILGS